MTLLPGVARPGGVLGDILERKSAEVRRRMRHPAPAFDVGPLVDPEVLRRAALPRVIAEVKFASPSAGAIRPWAPGAAIGIARGYEAGGAAAVSVLADFPGFGGSPLRVRRVARAVSVPVLFKEFVLHERQVALAAACGARLVLLLVRALERARLEELVACCTERGLRPVVEAADLAEMDVALATGAAIVGINARDLRTFQVDPTLAQRALERVPAERVAVYMSGVRSREDLRRVADGRADAVLVGEGLMRARDPQEALAAWLR